ncbi:hypothetical protein V8G54_004567 [Vigna mungo]|uniref:Zinc finger LSD1-type domain-containing protein n=1 Tax=Vigna mungo TaxID=3915 RepID=A0AAQ3PCS9_VIGMU
MANEFDLDMPPTNATSSSSTKSMVEKVNLSVLDVETFSCIQLEPPLCAVLFAMQSQQCHLLVAKSQTLMRDRHRNGPVSLRRLPYSTHVHPWSDKCAMFLLSHGQSSVGRYFTINVSIFVGNHQVCIESANQVAHVNCGNCRMLLMYQYGARSVKCAATTSTTEQKFNTVTIQ